jgi:hypothetical protein
MMSLSKSVPEGLNPRKCEQTNLHKPPPVPYIPEKDKVQEEVAKLCQLQIGFLTTWNPPYLIPCLFSVQHPLVPVRPVWPVPI